ncbi:LysM peptidoglycan-binding domain-containing protein [Megasphaera sp. UPII 135-E]|uniref:LysM peptidoglycan-binding domain-containing protein n=1 Tax=Megasphaera sp. UPII 135-E TaxID=1000569 RepID=UPI00021A2205|nr:LysM peptidoglycan-binding domain-containing protein [Megasphaera sp. UPII 135-E]EGS36191.1 LysM domain protein [Megasphaera sp. UPII 135-E]DAK43009.1 MAG TPA: cell division suppressor protein [Caudoviricetes sp.]
MPGPRRRNRYRWGRISPAVIILPVFVFGIVSGVKALMTEPEYVEKVVVVNDNETLWDICSKINDDREDVRVMIYRTMDRNHITDARKIQPGQKLLVPILKEK